MGREINVGACDRLDLRDTADANQAALRMLETAFAERLAAVGVGGVTIDSVLEIARAHGYSGTVEEAARILRVAGFIIEAGPSGRTVVRWAGGAP
jgi:hypothetical protein